MGNTLTKIGYSTVCLLIQYEIINSLPGTKYKIPLQEKDHIPNQIQII